jgi:hypothetical protein
MTQQGTGRGTPGPTGAGRTRTDGDASARLWLRLFLLTLLVLPWKVLALVLSLFALGAGVVALVKAIGAKLPRLVLVATSLGLAAALFLLAGIGASVLLWPVTQTYEDCMSRALTLEAQGQCEDGLRELEGFGS